VAEEANSDDARQVAEEANSDDARQVAEEANSDDARQVAEEANSDGARWLNVPIALPPEGETAAFELEGRALLLCNAEGQPYVLHDECPHVRVSMAGGRIRGSLLECPLHGGLMDVRDGAPAGLPIRRPGTCHAVRVEDGRLQVDLSG